MKLLKAVLKGLKAAIKAGLALFKSPARLTAPDRSSVETLTYWHARTAKLLPGRRIIITTRK